MNSASGLKIVSLISSGTEILCALGLEKNLVGISHECDFPDSIKHLPRLSSPRLDPQQRGSVIHSDLKALVEKGLSIYNIDSAKLEALAPDLIVTQDQCDVCAVSLKDVEKAVCHFTKKGTQICTMTPHTLDDIHKDFMRVGAATNRKAEAEDLVTQFWIKLNSVNARAGTSRTDKPKILCLEWLEPLIVAGGWIPEIVKLAGAEPLIVNDAKPFKTIQWNEALESNPDVILILPCGYPIEKTMLELEDSTLSSKLSAFDAVKQGRCFVCDGNNYFNRPGPRIADTTEIIAAASQPEKFSDFKSKYHGKAYQVWQPQSIKQQ